MNLNQLQTFFYVISENSISKAANKLNISQPAVSASLKRLEQSLEKTLLERTNRGILLTSEGETLYEYCHEIFAKVELIEKEFFKREELVKGPLRIGTSDDISSYLLSNILNEVNNRYPEVRPDIYTGGAFELLEMLKQGKLDLLILFYTPSLPEGISEEIINEVNFHGVIRKDLKGKKDLYKKLIGDSIMINSHKTRFKFLKEHISKHQIQDLFLSTNNINTQLQEVVNGKGVAFLPSFMVLPMIKSNKLAYLNRKNIDKHSLKIVMRNSFIPNKAHKDIINYLRSL